MKSELVVKEITQLTRVLDLLYPRGSEEQREYIRRAAAGEIISQSLARVRRIRGESVPLFCKIYDQILNVLMTPCRIMHVVSCRPHLRVVCAQTY